MRVVASVVGSAMKGSMSSPTSAPSFAEKPQRSTFELEKHFTQPVGIRVALALTTVDEDDPTIAERRRIPDAIEWAGDVPLAAKELPLILLGTGDILSARRPFPAPQARTHRRSRLSTNASHLVAIPSARGTPFPPVTEGPAHGGQSLASQAARHSSEVRTRRAGRPSTQPLARSRGEPADGEQADHKQRQARTMPRALSPSLTPFGDVRELRNPRPQQRAHEQHCHESAQGPEADVQQQLNGEARQESRSTADPPAPPAGRR